ncbi:MAG: T9SS type A sorting domain-containing protein [Bacteroidetes bacterium]|nr:T9SS type A sorting domain-containing protein [Bacteroidota bacterium]
MMKKSIQPIIIILAALLLFSPQQTFSQGYRILPLGNSITVGWNGTTPPEADAISYRNELYNQLSGALYTFDFVGHDNAGWSILSDSEHGGISGSRGQYVVRLLQDGYDLRWSEQITTGSQPYLDQFPADIILLHIGTNDITHGEGSAATDVENILDEIDLWELSSGTHVAVFVAQIISRTDSPADSVLTETYNDNLATMIAGRGDASVFVVDMEHGALIDYATEMEADGIHPGQAAYDSMGIKWFAELDKYMGALPATPGGFSLGGETSSSILLTWSDDADNESGYEIERSANGSGGTFALVHTTGTGASSWTDTNLDDETLYYYRIRAINATGPSLYTSILSTSTLLAVPNPPTVLTVENFSSASIELSWTDNSDNESGFEIERSLTASPGGFSPLITTGAETTGHTDNNGLAELTTYYYRIRATNAAGSSTYSNVVSATTTQTAPAAPTGLATGTITTSSIQLTWNDIAINESSYVVQRSLSFGSGYNTDWTIAANSTSFTDSPLPENTLYYYRVYASNGAGNSTYSNVVSARTLLSIPDAPTGLSIGVVTSSSIAISWDDNSDNESGFEIEQSLPPGDDFSLIHTTSPGVQGYNNTSLDDNVTYYYRVRAINTAGNSAYTPVASATTDLAAPDAPSALTVGTVTSTTIQISWSDESDSETGFEVERSLSLTGGYGWVFTTNPDIETFTDTNLDDNLRYYYRVRAVNGAGESSYTSSVSARTPLAPPDDPTTLILSGVTTSSISLIWTDNSDSELGFQIERSTDTNDNYSVIHIAGPDVQAYTNIGLEDNTLYYYRVRAYNAAGFSGYTAEASATTQLSAPSAPSGLTLDNISHNSMRLNWVDNSDNETNFEVERSLTPGTGFVPITSTAADITTYTNSGLLENTTYYYRVRATNASGNSPFSSEISATTLLLAPNAPSNLVLSNITVSTIDLSWVDNSTTESGFEIERSLRLNNGYQLIFTAGADVVTYADVNLDDNTEYFYRVRAINASGFSTYTLVVNATTLLDVPDAPSALEAAVTSVCAIDLKWTDNSDSEVRFEIERSPSVLNGFTVVGTTTADEVTFTDLTSTNFNRYYYRVRAYNASGYSEYSPIRSVAVNIVLSGGTIGVDQAICPSGDPEEILNIVPPSGGGGTWIYQWQSRITTGIFTDIPGATGLIYNPPMGLAETTEYQRVATTECGVVLSNIVTITVEDSELPVFTYCPNDTTILIERHETTAQVLPSNPIVTDNCEIVALTWSLAGATTSVSPATGINYVGSQIFNQGLTIVTYRGEDILGNIAQCSFNVIVEKKRPEVLNVSIPNGYMKIGDVITATITTGNDGELAYSLLTGSIGGYPLTNFQRINATTYLANITITEGGNSYAAVQDIPVENLVLSDGSASSLPFIIPIAQDNDLLDAMNPVIASMTAVPGAYKIGDVLHIDIVSDGLYYTIHPNSIINGIYLFFEQANVVFSETGGGNYRLSYTIQEGELDVEQGELNVTVMLIKPSGNIGEPNSTVGNTNAVSIDAHSPALTRLEVPSIAVGVGGTVQVTITSDGEGYNVESGTVINGIPLSSSRVSYSELTGGLYELSYVVASGDGAVTPGLLEVSLVMSDPSGNISSPYSVLQSNSLEIYTGLPTANIAGATELCEEEPAELQVFLSGRSPWSIELSDGTTTTTYENITDPEYGITIMPTRTTTYLVSQVTDVNGVVNSGSNSLEVTVHPKTDVEIINMESGYGVESDPVQLEASISGGTFSGPGVSSITGIFSPALADTVDSPHTIYYKYENDNGCISVDSALVFVLGAEGDIFIPSGIVCDDGDEFDISASNIASATGSFVLLNENQQEVSGLTDHHDNTATVDPGVLPEGFYTIEYEYIDDVTLYLRVSFVVESVGTPVITSQIEDSYCQSDAPFALVSDMPGTVFSGAGVTGNVAGGFMFDPGLANIGGNTVICTFGTESGCSNSSQVDIMVLFAPEVLFTLSTNCIPVEGGYVTFGNLTSGKVLVESWEWNFGDDDSGENNSSNLVDPSHFYQVPGEYSIGLTVTTTEGCVSSMVVDTLLASQPVADFTWISDCYVTGEEVKFMDRSSLGISLIDSLEWSFFTAGDQLMGEIITTSSMDSVRFAFPSLDDYKVRLITNTGEGCVDTVNKVLELRPTIELDSEGYIEGFNDSEGSWMISSDDQVESWTWDVPDFKGYDQNPENKAWFTALPDDEVDYLEKSWIQSPCFDFRGIDNPLIKLDIMRSFIPSINGAVLQYRDVYEEGWKTVGDQSPGIEWYNSHDITNKPGGSVSGWTLQVFNPDSLWVSAMHDLNQVDGISNVAFRVALATTGAQGIGNQGFAFDNVAISERSKRTVIEYFTNSSDVNSATTDAKIEAITKEFQDEVIDLHYHMDYPGLDPMNENNPDLVSNRSDFFYGVPEVPYAILDGGEKAEYRYNFAGISSGLMEDHLSLLSLEIPSFEIELEVEWLESGLLASSTVTCVSQHYSDFVQLYVAVFETSVTAYTGANGKTTFRNVMLDMLPSHGGKLIGDNWVYGESDTWSYPWIYPGHVEDEGDLAVAAFIQDRTTYQILQAAVVYKDPLVGIDDPKTGITELHLYPNPASDHFFLNLGNRTQAEGRVELLDMNGRLLIHEIVPPGNQIIQVDIQDIDVGVYIVRWTGSEGSRGLSKIVKTR